jgi:hypothetical protein
LGARNAEPARALVGIGFEHSRYVHDRKGDFALDRHLGHFQPSLTAPL